MCTTACKVDVQHSQNEKGCLSGGNKSDQRCCFAVIGLADEVKAAKAGMPI